MFTTSDTIVLEYNYYESRKSWYIIVSEYHMISYLYSVKRSDVTRWKQGYITPPPPYFIQ